MDSQTLQKSKRGRKRQSDEECLSDADRLKKEKNRKAAQKCREKKEKEANDLKIRNEELERENKKLSEEKKKLEERAQEFHKIIKHYIQKGFQLPSHIQELYNEDTEMISMNGDDGNEVFRAVGTIERDHTPPHTPEDTSPEKSPSHLQYSIHHSTEHRSEAPTALFSGTPLSDHDIARRRSDSCSRSTSSSLSLPLSPAKTVPAMTGKQKDLTYFLTSNKLPKALAPISPIRQETDQNDTAQFVHHSGQILPTVVSELDDESENTTDYNLKYLEMIDSRRINVMPIQVNDVEETDLQQDILSEDEVTKQLSLENGSTSGDESNQNLSSLGFTSVLSYSYIKDLEQMEPVNPMIEYSNCVHQNDSQSISSEKWRTNTPSSRHSESQPVIDVNVCAPALLEMCTEMSESLQQQIKTSYSNSSISVPQTISVCGGNKRNVTMPQEQQDHPNIQINYKSDFSQQPMNLLKGQQWVSQEQALQILLKASKNRQMLTNESSSMLNTLVSNGQTRAIMKQDLVSQILPVVQKLSSSQPQDASKKVQIQELHHLQRQVLLHGPQSNKVSSVQLLRLPPAVAAQSSNNFAFPQTRQQQQMAASPAQANLSKENSSPTAGQAVSYTSSMTSLQPHYSNSSESLSSSSHQLAQHYTPIVKLPPSNDYCLINTQVTETHLRSGTTSQTLGGCSDYTVITSENIDYSANVKDLPSLNLIEMQSDSNLFEKQPSRLTS